MAAATQRHIDIHAGICLLNTGYYFSNVVFRVSLNNAICLRSRSMPARVSVLARSVSLRKAALWYDGQMGGIKALIYTI